MGREGNVRDNLIPQAAEEENRNFGDGRDDRFGRPDLVAEDSEIFCRWNNAKKISTCSC
jgi:hypothetical protein